MLLKYPNGVKSDQGHTSQSREQVYLNQKKDTIPGKNKYQEKKKRKEKKGEMNCNQKKTVIAQEIEENQ